MLKIICGEPGTGKSSLLFERIKQSAQGGKKAYLFIPDQFSFEAEKLIYKNIPHSLHKNVTVTMFSRCAQKLLHIHGETKEYADDIVKHILMKRTLSGAVSSGALMYYSGQCSKRGFPAFALGIISELRSAGITPSQLKSTVSSDNGFSDILTRKMNDISVIYSLYDELLTLKFDDRLDDIRRAARLVSETDIFKGTDIYFDCFEKFSGNQINFIKALMEKADSVTFAFTADSPDSRERRCASVCRLIGRLTQAADGEREVTVLSERFRRPERLTAVRADDMWQECDWICAKIHELTENGMRFRDIAVIAPDPAYNLILDSTMKKYGIRCFTDIPEPIITRSFVRFILHTLKALSFSTEDILRYVKSGFVRHSGGKVISNIQSDALEKLCAAYDLRKRDWLRPFPEKLDETGELEELRKSIIEPLLGLKKRTDGADGEQITKELCSFLCDTMDISSTIYGKCITGRSDDGKLIVDNAKTEEYSSIWDDVVTIFESAYNALSGCYMSIEEYTDILTEIFTSQTVAKPPQVLDAVTVGDTERSRFPEMKAVFLCGFSQGAFPPPSKSADAFTPSECERLRQAGLPAGTDRLERYSDERFTVWRCINLPSRELFISSPMINASGELCEPSRYLEEISKLFDTEYLNAGELDPLYYCRTEESTLRCLASIYRERDKQAEKNALMKVIPAEQRDMLRFAAGEIPFTDRHIVSREKARALMSLNTYSPTAVGTANRCKFDFFCRYGLGLREDSKRGIDALLSGSVIHFCLERLLTDYADRREEFVALTDGEIEAHTAKSIKEFERVKYYGGFGGAERFSYLLSRLGRFAAKAGSRIRDEIKESGFYPEALEKELSFKFGDITIKGVCDRLDTMVSGGVKYIRVVDYKRGSHTFRLGDVYAGEDLQMLLYLFGLCENGDLPASVMYLPYGKISRERSDGSDIEEKTLKSLNRYIKEHSPAGIVVSGSPDVPENKGLTDISREAFDSLKNYCRAYVNAKIQETLSGMAGACPDSEESCEYCAHALFCGRKQTRQKKRSR